MIRLKTLFYWFFLETILLGGALIIAIIMSFSIFSFVPLIVRFLFFAILLHVIIALWDLKNPEVANADLYQFEDKEGGDES